MSKNMGFVYVMTNPYFREGLVKIGWAVDLEERVDTLSSATGVPDKFEVYAALKTVKYKEVEKFLHNFVDRISIITDENHCSLRVNKRREFFEIQPEDAYELLVGFTKILDDAEVNLYENNKIVSKTKNTKKFAKLRAKKLSEKLDAGMSDWMKTLLKIIEGLGETFSLQEVYDNGRILQRKYPKNNTIKASIRHNLQELRDRGFIEFLDNDGRYKKL